MEDQGVESRGAASAAPPIGQSGLDLIGLTKVFPGGTVAVDDVNLHVDHGEYVVLLGPSGCGKTTTLRMIGGHEHPTQGEILLDGESLIDLPPHKRPTTTVFQHFALFPHRTTLQNVEFGLKMHGVGKAGAAGGGDEGARDGRARAARRPQAERPLGRAAAARGPRPRPRDQAEGAAARRAARRPRPAAAAAHARGAPQPAAPARADVHPRHAQPGRGPLDGGPDRRHERRPDPADRRSADDRHEARHGARRALHGRQQHPPWGRHGARGRSADRRERGAAPARERARTRRVRGRSEARR